MLYQHDTKTGTLRRVVVGSLSGHMSRNLIADARGHVYVPRLRSSGEGILSVTLVEFDSDLREVGATAIEGYANPKQPRKSHGLTGLVYLADGSMVVSTHLGALYRVTPRASGPARVSSLGPIHPLGRSYPPSLFTFAGERYVVGVVRQKKRAKGDKRRHVWAVYDLETGRSRIVDFPFPGRALIYGSITRDQQGHFYAVGRYKPPGAEHAVPLVLQIETGP